MSGGGGGAQAGYGCIFLCGRDFYLALPAAVRLAAFLRRFGGCAIPCRFALSRELAAPVADRFFGARRWICLELDIYDGVHRAILGFA